MMHTEKYDIILIHAIGKLLKLGNLVRHLAHLVVARLLARCHRRRGRHSARHHCRLAEHILSAAVCLARVLLAILLIKASTTPSSSAAIPRS